jgi:hypothetical protein
MRSTRVALRGNGPREQGLAVFVMLLLAGRDIAIDRISRLTESRQIRQVFL